MNVLAFFNHAGGVGKSSAACDVTYLLGERGLRVLLIDADLQASPTEWLGITDDVRWTSCAYRSLIVFRDALVVLYRGSRLLDGALAAQ